MQVLPGHPLADPIIDRCHRVEQRNKDKDRHHGQGPSLNPDQPLLKLVKVRERERERERVTPFQPHKADAGAARVSPGRSRIHNQRE